jgi:hypothetical protein
METIIIFKYGTNGFSAKSVFNTRNQPMPEFKMKARTNEIKPSHQEYFMKIKRGTAKFARNVTNV